ncbi:MAG: PhoX family phosphatase, partial [Alphaproteobacteria bacterium]
MTPDITDDEAPIDASEDIGSNPSTERPFAAILSARIGRRAALAGLASVAAAGILGRGPGAPSEARAQAHGPGTTRFVELPQGMDATDHVPAGYAREVVIRWGDKVLADAPAFDVARQTGDAQARQFGYNCDFLAYCPLPAGSAASDHGLLWVNHEYVNSNLMFAGLGVGREARLRSSAAQVAVEMAAHGGSIVEVRRTGGRWAPVDGPMNRRITAATPMRIAGPAAGHPRMRTGADPEGRTVLGMINNCAGGTTPWGTVLTCEENFNGYFMGDPDAMPEGALMKRYGITKQPWYAWWRYEDRFDMA